jgi:hypothetical protein
LGASLDSGLAQFTLAAGTYLVKAQAPAFYCSQHRIRLWNVSDATTALLGTSELTNPGTGDSSTCSTINEVLTIATSKTFQLEHRVAASKSLNGYGVPNGWDTEIYSDIFIQKIG